MGARDSVLDKKRTIWLCIVARHENKSIFPADCPYDVSQIGDPEISYKKISLQERIVWKSQKKSHSTLRAKRAMFTFWVDKS